jgi:thioredoxin
MAYINLTADKFSDTVEQNDIVILDFWAEWCGPCIQFGPIFEQAAEENLDITFAKVNTETEQELAAHFQVQSIPTLMVIKEQVVIFNQAGALDEAGLNSLIAQVKELDMDKVRAEMDAQKQ